MVEKIEWDDETRDRIRTIGLKLACVARAGVDADAEGRIFEVSGGLRRLLLKFKCCVTDEEPLRSLRPGLSLRFFGRSGFVV